MNITFTFHRSHILCPSTAGCNPPSMSSIVFCLLLSCSRWFPPSLLCRLAIFCFVVLLISSLSLVDTLCSVWSIYCPSFLQICPADLHFCFRVYSIMSIIFVLFLNITYAKKKKNCLSFNKPTVCGNMLSLIRNRQLNFRENGYRSF